MKLRYYALSLLLYLYSVKAIEQITIVIVIDQCTHAALQQIAPYTQGGIRELMEKGVVYDNAHFPYAKTSTGPGHATLNTGTLPKEHGIVANYWYDIDGQKVACDHDTEENAAILAPQGFYKKSKSAQHARVDGISDQLMFTSNKHKKNYAYALSLKSRAAIFTAGRQGKAIFFDARAGQFTSTKAYFSELPDWLAEFNKKKKLSTLTNIPWKLCYSAKSPAYAMANKNYSFARLPSAINRQLSQEFMKKDTHKEHHCFNFITYSPQSNKLLLDCAEECIQSCIKENPNKLLLWISLSSLDKVGHIYGPRSLEYIDTLYHIDRYLKNFMDNVKTMIPEEKIFYALTADHGSTPVVEYLKEQKFTLAERLLIPKLEKKMNKKIANKYGIKECVKEIDNPSVFLDNSKLKNLSPKEKRALLFDLKHFLKKQKGIKNVWTHEELEKSPVLDNDFTLYYKNQLFPGRTGSLIFQTYPYTYVSDDPLGTGHVACYNYTTHVPLIFYKPGKTKHTLFKQRISMAQFAPTLAAELSIPSPSACVANALELH